MMKQVTKLLTGLFLFVAVSGARAQANKECTLKYNLFKGNVTTKKYAEAKPQLDYLMQNCPTLSVNIYKYGAKLAEKTKDANLMKSVYEARIKNFPKKGAAKAHSDYASFVLENKLSSEQEVFNLLEKAYTISPKEMSVKNIYRYFEGTLNKYKDTDPQKVFDTYDNVMESVGEKLDDYNAKISPLLVKEEGGTLSAKEKKKLRAYKINSKALGQVEGGLDAKIESIATCERLIPLLSRDFEAHKTDATWLRRSVSRLHHKDCKTDPLYEKLALKYAEVAQTADAYTFAAGVKETKGDQAGATALRKKAFDLETDPKKKAKYKLMEAQDAGRGAKARSLALEALKYNPNLGKAYLFIASIYAKSANSCGTNEFEKRMVYVAALNKALKARAVDPGCGAGRYISNYKNNIPSKKLIFNQGVKGGSNHKVGCWIGETVKVPNL